MNKILVAVVAATLSTEAAAVDFGVGVSAKSDDSWIYFPIEITQRFRLEPSVRFSQTESHLETEDTFFGTRSSTRVDTDTDQLQVGLGVFGVLPVKESVRVYYGVRAAYIDADTSSTQVTRLESPFSVSEETFKRENSADGYRVAPTLGFEYFVTAHFSIGGEAEWFYQEIDQKTQDDQDDVRIDQDSNGTDTHLVVRYRF